MCFSVLTWLYGHVRNSNMDLGHAPVHVVGSPAHVDPMDRPHVWGESCRGLRQWRGRPWLHKGSTPDPSYPRHHAGSPSQWHGIPPDSRSAGSRGRGRERVHLCLLLSGERNQRTLVLRTAPQVLPSSCLLKGWAETCYLLSLRTKQSMH